MHALVAVPTIIIRGRTKSFPPPPLLIWTLYYSYPNNKQQVNSEKFPLLSLFQWGVFKTRNGEIFLLENCPNQQIKANCQQTGVKANCKQTRVKANCKQVVLFRFFFYYWKAQTSYITLALLTTITYIT